MNQNIELKEKETTVIQNGNVKVSFTPMEDNQADKSMKEVAKEYNDLFEALA